MPELYPLHHLTMVMTMGLVKKMKNLYLLYYSVTCVSMVRKVMIILSLHLATVKVLQNMCMYNAYNHGIPVKSHTDHV
jgi:hypothetical protein